MTLPARPSSQAVLATLSTFCITKTKKIHGQLAVRLPFHTATTCFCIQGVFAATALKLGFPGDFSLSDPHTGTLKLNLLLPQDLSWFSTLNIPPCIFEFLGLPEKVSPENLTAAGLAKTLESSSLKPFDSWNVPGFSWSALNDNTDLSLEELIDLAKQLVKQSGTTSG